MPLPSIADNQDLSARPAALYARLFANGKNLALAAGKVLFFRGDASDGCYRLDEGLVKASVISVSGGERILSIMGPGAIVGELSLLGGTPRSASVEALRDCKLRFVSRAAFENFAAANPELYRDCTLLLARRLLASSEALVAETFSSLKGRVAHALLKLCEAFGQDVGDGRLLIKQRITQRDLAAMAGISRENVSRILKHWIDGGAVSRLAGYYCLENRAKIESEIED